MTVSYGLFSRLTAEMAAVLKEMPEEELAALEEIRVYLNRPVELVIADRRKRTGLVADKAQMDKLLAALSGHALYRFERQMAEGYIPLEGGVRAGVCGTMAKMEDGSWRMSSVSSVCIRIARDLEGVSIPIHGHLFSPEGRTRSLLLLGAPGCGKTTMLRDAARCIARWVHVAVVDERMELFGQPADMNAEGMDVLSGVEKPKAFSMLIRSMAPVVIVCDELGRDEDVFAILDAARCGVSVLASAHAGGVDDLLMRPVMRRLFDAGVFERYIHLRNHEIEAVWDGAGNRMEGKEKAEYGKLGNGHDGDDWREQRRISFVGR